MEKQSVIHSQVEFEQVDSLQSEIHPENAWPAYSWEKLLWHRSLVLRIKTSREIACTGADRMSCRYYVLQQELTYAESCIIQVSSVNGSAPGLARECVKNLKAYVNLITMEINNPEPMRKYFAIIEFFSLSDDSIEVVMPNGKKEVHNRARLSTPADFEKIFQREADRFNISDSLVAIQHTASKLIDRLGVFEQIMDDLFPGEKRSDKNYTQISGLIAQFRDFLNNRLQLPGKEKGEEIRSNQRKNLPLSAESSGSSKKISATGASTALVVSVLVETEEPTTNPIYTSADNQNLNQAAARYKTSSSQFNRVRSIPYRIKSNYKSYFKDDRRRDSEKSITKDIETVESAISLIEEHHPDCPKSLLVLKELLEYLQKSLKDFQES